MADVAAVKNREPQANVIGRVILWLTLTGALRQQGSNVQTLEHENQNEGDN